MNTSQKRTLKKNKALLARARKVIPRAAQTLSKAPDQFVEGVSPYAIQKGKGAYVWDVDGNKYIDLTASLGAVLLGHGHPVTEKAVATQRKEGTIFGLPGGREVELAEVLTKLNPFIEMVRFGMNGSDVTTAAIRAARAYTGRDHIAKCGYHGWADWSIATHPIRSGGIPQAVKDLTHEFAYNDLESLRKILVEFRGKTAAVILEPTHSTPPQKGFLEGVAKLAREHGAVLIFDELVTGFRLTERGAAGYFKVEPDLVCYGKAISNGEPLSVLAGRRKIMNVLDEKDIFFSFTYAGFLPSIAAALANIAFMRKHKVQKVITTKTEALMKRVNALARLHNVPMKAQGVGPIQQWIFRDSESRDNLPLKSLFIQECAKEGVLLNGSIYLTYAFTDQILRDLDKRLARVFAVVGAAEKEGKVNELLEGPVIRPRARPAN